jgi:hypothetical protein
MAVRVTRPDCAEPLRLDEALAGSTARCARCDRPFTSPPAWSIQPHAAPAHAALPTAQTPRRRIVATCLKGRGDFRLSLREE